MADATALWRPSTERAERSQMYDFMNRTADRHGVGRDWEALRRWSIEHREEFWAEFLDHAGIQLSTPCTEVYRGARMYECEWFVGAKLNYARHLLRFDDDRPALVGEDERGGQVVYARSELRAEVARCAAALRREGVKLGDRVVGFMPNIPETVIAMLATASLGATWSSCSPDFGIGGVLDRFGQIAPTVLFTADGYTYNGKAFDSLERVRGILEKLPSVRRVVVVPFLNSALSATSQIRRGGGGSAGGGSTQHSALGTQHSALATAALWRDFLGSREDVAPPLFFEEVPFDHPLFIMYSSGTTGVPKCIVHGHGGTLIQHMKELMLHTDLHRDDVLFYFTTCGWMMWNWLVSGLGVGATVVLYEGSPSPPGRGLEAAPTEGRMLAVQADIARLWRMAERLKINVFGASPKFLAACKKAELHPGRDFDLSPLRCVLSTGSPLTVEEFEWVYAEVKADVQLASISGGTDIISCFMLGNPLLPVYAGEIQCRGLGMDVYAYNPEGRPVIGQKGELVCTAPFPSRPVSFWNDPDRSKYRKAYFDYYPAVSPQPSARGTGPSALGTGHSALSTALGVWRHGDFIEITPHGGVIVYGRSDATLNPGGVRIGTAEIYRQVEGMSEILDSIVVGKNTPDGDVDVVLFVVLRPGIALDDALVQRIKQRIAEGTTKRHVPKYIKLVTDIPRTISGKKVEIAVTQVLHGEDVLNRDALANPEALEQFRAG